MLRASGRSGLQCGGAREMIGANLEFPDPTSCWSSPMRLAAFLLLAWMIPSAWSREGGTVDFKDGRVAETELAGPWRFHAGDGAAWANPEFDDSNWSLLVAGKPWSTQGYRGY